jgi:hypothetical protein
MGRTQERVALIGHEERSRATEDAISTAARFILEATTRIDDGILHDAQRVGVPLLPDAPYKEQVNTKLYRVPGHKTVVLPLRPNERLREVRVARHIIAPLDASRNPLFRLKDITGSVVACSEPLINTLSFSDMSKEGISSDGRTANLEGQSTDSDFLYPIERAILLGCTDEAPTPALQVISGYVMALETTQVISQAVREVLGIEVPDGNRAKLQEQWIAAYQVAFREATLGK